MGGVLSRPSDRFPKAFSSTFWKQYPYFLPCGVAAAFCALSFLATALLLQEVRPLNHLSPQAGNACEQYFDHSLFGIDPTQSQTRIRIASSSYRGEFLHATFTRRICL